HSNPPPTRPTTDSSSEIARLRWCEARSGAAACCSLQPAQSAHTQAPDPDAPESHAGRRLFASRSAVASRSLWLSAVGRRSPGSDSFLTEHLNHGQIPSWLTTPCLLISRA